MEFDIAIIGGGINGTGMAREAAYRGYRTLLLEKDDFAQATSSQSTKMIHGGIRYLETGDFHLVYESLHERSILLKIAPHLVTPLEIVIPIYQGSLRSGWLVRLGTLIYDLMAGRRNLGRSHSLSRKEIQSLSGLKQSGLKSAIGYYDAQVFDSRLCLENALSAREAGAVVLNYHPVDKAGWIGADGADTNGTSAGGIRAGGNKSGYVLEGRDLRTNQPFRFLTRAVINATGPWVPFFEKTSLGHPTKSMVYDRGIHLVVPSLGLKSGLALMCRDRRLIFVLPWRKDYTLIGTTETKYSAEDFTRIPVSEEEIDYLLENFNFFFPERNLSREDILYFYSGVRTLVAGQNTSLTKLSREADIRVFSEAPETAWLIIYGGKLTSYRALAEQALDKLARKIPPPQGSSPLSTRETPLYGGGEIPDLDLSPPFLTPALREAWQARFGSRWVDIAQLALDNPQFQEMVIERFQFTMADLAYMVTVEFAYQLEDIVIRRTTMDYTLTGSEKRRLEDALAQILAHQPFNQ